jgi:glucan-binding YG repeat protein
LNEKYKSQGYLKINGEYYCLKNDGTPRTGEWKINGSMYYLEPDSAIPGRMFREGWKKFVNEKGEKWVYYNRDSKGADRGKAVKYNGNVAITITPLSTKTKYLLDHNGYILKSKHVQTVDGSWYGSNSQGQIYKNQIVKYGNYRYYFTASGKQVGWKNMWKQVPSADNRYYYFGSTAGRISEKTGWQYVTWPSGKFLGWFYFQSNGEHYRDIMVSDYYFDKTGKLASGVTTVNGKTYFFEVSSNITRRGTMLKGTMISYNGNWYYAEADGQLANNVWKQIDGSWYRFENYVTQTNTFRWMGSTYGYLNSQGKFCTGWIIYSNSQNLVRYVNPNGGGFYNNTSAVIDGLRYYFDSNGYRINDLTSVYKGPYYLKADRVNGVMTVYDSTRTVPVKTIRISVGASGTETPLGTYSMTRGLRWQLLMGPSYGQYSTHVNGAGQGGIYVHSVSGSAANSYSLPAAQYNKLGTPASHGCIRTCVADAKWVYDNCNGATITIFDGTYEANEAFKGPLGRKQLEPLRYPYNYDPTDPAV